MANRGLPPSVVLCEAAGELKDKGHFARAAEKFGRAAAAAAQELAGAEDCLVVAYLRAGQAGSLISHSLAPTLTAAEQLEARQTVISVLLPQCVSTLTRRKAAGTLMPGSCRAAEVSWASKRPLVEEGMPAAVARARTEASARFIGYDAYICAAHAAMNVLVFSSAYSTSRETHLPHAAFVASAFELMAQPQEVVWVIVNGVKIGVLSSLPEHTLARNVRRVLRDALIRSNLDGELLSVMADAWQRVERSDAAASRDLLIEAEPYTTIGAGYAAAAAEGAVRGLRGCELAGCASKEVHVSQFKRCAACQQAFYSCREHQVADWPAHKAACKAARKAATPSSK
jgi:hypothetical protein